MKPFSSFRLKLTGLSGLLGVALFLGIWELVPRVGLANPTLLPPFSAVVAAVIQLSLSGDLGMHVVASLQRSLYGLMLAIALGVPLGIAMGRLQVVERFADPVLQSFRQTSALALFPVFLLVFGVSELSKVAVVFWAAVWPILLNTMSGARHVDPILIRSAKTLGATQMDVFRKVVLPASVPSIFTGIRLSAAVSLIVLIAAEMLGAKAGLGFLVFYSQNVYKIPNMFAAITTLSIVGLVVNYALVGIEKRVGRWKEGTIHA
ncbi:MAG: ABC transporter permease [Chloroflexota bacterium]|nr:MAG: ABC transporter permease [Chloroflexota bacterium]